MGMEHERIHLETSSVLIRQLPVDMVTKPEGWLYGPVKAGELFGNIYILGVFTHMPYGKLSERNVVYIPITTSSHATSMTSV